MNEQKAKEFPYVQQHLANERTFLAWIRTGIAIVGVGFLSVGAVFRMELFTVFGRATSAVIGVGAIALGFLVMLLATKDYFAKRSAINEGRFASPGLVVILTFTSLGIVNLLLLALLLGIIYDY